MTDDLLEELQFKLDVLRQDRKNVTFKYRWLLNRGECLDSFYCICEKAIKIRNVLNIALKLISFTAWQ